MAKRDAGAILGVFILFEGSSADAFAPRSGNDFSGPDYLSGFGPTCGKTGAVFDQGVTNGLSETLEMDLDLGLHGADQRLWRRRRGRR